MKVKISEIFVKTWILWNSSRALIHEKFIICQLSHLVNNEKFDITKRCNIHSSVFEHFSRTWIKSFAKLKSAFFVCWCILWFLCIAFSSALQQWRLVMLWIIHILFHLCNLCWWSFLFFLISKIINGNSSWIFYKQLYRWIRFSSFHRPR